MSKTDVNGALSPERGRFEALLSGASEAPYDRQLFDGGDWVAAPSLGAIVPGWLLAVPRRPVLSFRDWEASGGSPVQSVLKVLSAHLGLRADELIWFEHGPAKAGSPVGCGLDHAHLHVLVHPRFTFDEFAERARASADLGWTQGTAASGYASLPKDLSYMIAGCGNQLIQAIDVERMGSQFFRRVVAYLAGDFGGWNYRSSAHLDNVVTTISMFRQLENALRRGD